MLVENNRTKPSHPCVPSGPHHTHHSHELADIEIDAVVEGKEAAYHQDEDGEEQREVNDSLAHPVSRRIKPRYLQLCVCFDLQWEKKMPTMVICSGTRVGSHFLLQLTTFTQTLSEHVAHLLLILPAKVRNISTESKRAFLKPALPNATNAGVTPALLWLPCASQGKGYYLKHL